MTVAWLIYIDKKLSKKLKIIDKPIIPPFLDSFGNNITYSFFLESGQFVPVEILRVVPGL